MMRPLVVAAAILFMAGCETLWQKPVVSNRDPMMVYCKAVGLIRWDSAMRDIPAVESTLRQIKIHNGARRQNCPGDKYPVWYYDEVGSPPPSTEKMTVTP